MRVADAAGAPPTIPFWLGEAPARSDELSRAVSDLRADLDRALGSPDAAADGHERRVIDWLASETGLAAAGAEQVVGYAAEGRRALGVIPTQDTLVLERFFDEAGGMQLVLHAPFGSRINRAWGLALRKRFCRQFNFELQAAATEDALLLSLGPQHSFPLSDVFRYLHPATMREVLVQAFLDAPVFQTRWRWNTTIALAVPRRRGGRKLAAQIQRMLADDLMAAVFPDAAACLENIAGDREIPDHPLVTQAVRDCLQEAMDHDGLASVLERIHAGALTLVARDTPEPSCFAHEILNANPYAFLDDAPLEERRTHAVQSRRAGEPSRASDLGALDPAAIERVAAEARPGTPGCRRAPRCAVDRRLSAGERGLDDRSRTCRRSAGHRSRDAGDCFRRTSADRRNNTFGSRRSAFPSSERSIRQSGWIPIWNRRCSRSARAWTRDDAIVEVLRGQLAILGPTTAEALAATLAIAVDDADAALARARIVRGGPARPIFASRIEPDGCAGMVRPQPPRTDSSLHAAQVARRDRAGDPGRLHAVPLFLAASRALVEADRDRRLARDRGAARRLRAFRGGLGAGRAAGPDGRIRATDARHVVPRRRGGVVEAVRAAVGTAGDAAARTGDAHRAASPRARRRVASAAWGRSARDGARSAPVRKRRQCARRPAEARRVVLRRSAIDM